MTRRAVVTVAIWVAACVAGIASLVAPAARPDPVPDALVGAAELREPAPDLALGSGTRAWELTVAPPWQRGAPATATAVVARDGHRPRPRGAFALETSAGGWTRWISTAEAGESAAPRAFLSDLLPRARVEIVRPDGTVRRCDRWVFGRWFCGPGEWNYVGPATVQVRGGQQHCTWAHPTDEGTLRIVFEGVQRGTAITGRHMLADVAVDSPVEGDVFLTLFVDGQELTRRRQERRRGVETFRVTLPEGDGPFDLVAEVSADTVAQRHFCIDLQVRGTPREEQ